MSYLDIYDACRTITSRTSPNIIVDLGARHGEGFFRLGEKHPNARYVFVEPSPKCISRLLPLVADHPGRLELIDGALGLENCLMEFFTFENDDDQSGNLYSDRRGTYGKATRYLVKSYDYRTVLPKEIDFVKCNIEGGEYQLIDDGFFDRVGSFVMEAHNSHVPNKRYVDVLRQLEAKFDLEVWGNTNYKYCFINGVRK